MYLTCENNLIQGVVDLFPSHAPFGREMFRSNENLNKLRENNKSTVISWGNGGEVTGNWGGGRVAVAMKWKRSHLDHALLIRNEPKGNREQLSALRCLKLGLVRAMPPFSYQNMSIILPFSWSHPLSRSSAEGHLPQRAM